MRLRAGRSGPSLPLVTLEDDARAGDARCRLHAEYLLGGGASEAEFLTAASFAASDRARAYGPLDEGFHLDAMNLSDQWDGSDDVERQGLTAAVHALAQRAVEELADKGT